MSGFLDYGREVGQALYQGDFAFAGLRRCVVGYAHVGFDELGKLDGLSAEEAAQVAETVGLGALKYFLL